MTTTCPCLLQDARSPSVRIVAGVRTLSWICKVCGSLNSETSEYPAKRSADVLHRHGGPRGPASVSDMGSTVIRP